LQPGFELPVFTILNRVASTLNDAEVPNLIPQVFELIAQSRGSGNGLLIHAS
jgi:hypothetical protein